MPIVIGGQFVQIETIAGEDGRLRCLLSFPVFLFNLGGIIWNKTLHLQKEKLCNH